MILDTERQCIEKAFEAKKAAADRRLSDLREKWALRKQIAATNDEDDISVIPNKNLENLWWFYGLRDKAYSEDD